MGAKSAVKAVGGISTYPPKDHTAPASTGGALTQRKCFAWDLGAHLAKRSRLRRERGYTKEKRVRHRVRVWDRARLGRGARSGGGRERGAYFAESLRKIGRLVPNSEQFPLNNFHRT